MSLDASRSLVSIGAATAGEGGKTSLFEAPVSSGESPIFPLS